MADIERLKRTLGSVPEHQAEEVTTAQAVRMLSSEIHAMRAKGYSLPSIAELLTDNGLAVTATTLKTYLSGARTAGGRKSGRKGKTRRYVGVKAAGTGETTASTSDAEPSDASGDTQLGGRAITKSAPAVTTSSAQAASPPTPKVTVRPSDDVSARRSAFVPKEDTRDI